MENLKWCDIKYLTAIKKLKGIFWNKPYYNWFLYFRSMGSLLNSNIEKFGEIIIVIKMINYALYSTFNKTFIYKPHLII